MKIKKMFSVTLALALLLQIFALALPVSAETVDETDTSSTGAATEAIDLKKQIVPQSEVPALIDYSVAVENKYTCRAYHMDGQKAFQKNSHCRNGCRQCDSRKRAKRCFKKWFHIKSPVAFHKSLFLCSKGIFTHSGTTLCYFFAIQLRTNQCFASVGKL